MSFRILKNFFIIVKFFYFQLIDLGTTWNSVEIGTNLVVEENGRKVRNTKNRSWGNAISDQGFSEGIHSWIIEFGRGDKDNEYQGWGVDVVCNLKINAYGRSMSLTQNLACLMSGNLQSNQTNRSRTQIR